MKELKSFIVLYNGKFIRAYHEAEVDEVIAALHDKLRQQNIFLGNYKLLLHSKVGFDKDPTETLRHNKYKRCLFMVDYYTNEVRWSKDYMSRCGGYDSYVNARINKLKKRLAIWTKLMNNFKEYK